ncbi:unnamed protein product [Caenorhabditis angaria]|uniref:Amino acid transporter n=1 Tax=Caenorhabditis angaria TaxID=860376 RepID=A0A9P1ING6_9PELO|nr:unnamed protein product [Caenorhabditis angaria]
MHEKHLLSITLLGVLTGILLGVFLRNFNLSDDFKLAVGFPGEIFMQILKLMILPLIFSSLISSLGQMNAKGSGKMGFLAVLYYMTTMIIASTIAVMFVFLIHPGDPKVKNRLIPNTKDNSDLTAFDALLDLLRNMFPQNIVEATIKRSQTTIKFSKKHVEKSEGTNILGIIVFCTIFGMIISKLGQKARIIVDFFIILDKVVMRFVSFLMWFSPFGIISLISSSILDIDDLAKMLSTMALYVTTIMICLFVHCVLAIPTLYFLLTRKNPWNIAKSMVQPFVTALGTASR